VALLSATNTSKAARGADETADVQQTDILSQDRVEIGQRDQEGGNQAVVRSGRATSCAVIGLPFDVRWGGQSCGGKSQPQACGKSQGKLQTALWLGFFQNATWSSRGSHEVEFRGGDQPVAFAGADGYLGWWGTAGTEDQERRGLNIIRVLGDWIASWTAPAAPPSAALRNFLLRVEAEGGFLFESDPLFKAWAEEAREASRLGLFVTEGGFGVGSHLTAKGRRVLSQFRETGAVTLGSLDKGYSGAPGGLVVARKAEPEA
jgi:hypothetical protein